MRAARLALGLALAGGAPACSPTPASELFVAVETDLGVPGDIDGVRVEILSGGASVLDQDYVAVVGGKSTLTLPATLGIVSDSGAGTAVDVRVTGLSGGIPVVTREAATTVPEGRAALLRMPLAWLCAGTAELGPDGEVVSTCVSGQTCVAGACASIDVDSGSLPDYLAADVFGGGTGDGDGACFDAVGCFSGAADAPLDASSCTALASGENLALRTQSGGSCGPTGCFVPLDADSDEGWQPVSGDAGQARLPPSVCTQLMAGTVLGVASSPVSGACAQKTASLPLCGPLSSAATAAWKADPTVPVALAAGQDHPTALALGATGVFWTNAGALPARTGSVETVAVTGGFASTVVSGTTAPHDLAIDGTTLAFTDIGATATAGSVSVVDLTGATPGATALATSQDVPEGVALQGGTVYWLAFGADAVYSVPVAGGSLTTLASPAIAAPYNPFRIAVDSDRAAFWTNEGTAGSSPPDGSVAFAPPSGAPMVFAAAQTTPRGLALDLDAGGAAVAVYWTSFADPGSVLMAPVVGGVPASAPTEIAVGQHYPNGIAVDGSHVYWTNWGDGTVARVAKGQPGAVTVLAQGRDAPAAIAVDAANVYWVDGGPTGGPPRGMVMRLGKPP